MEDYPCHYLPESTINDLFAHIPQPPRRLTIRGTFPNHEKLVFLTIVGSRNHSSYGLAACKQLIQGLRGYPIVIVSGLALGIDTIAHEAALEIGITTIAFPGSGLDEKIIYPRANRFLAEKILKSGGCLVSEFTEHQKTNDWLFPARNRLLAGLSHATLVIEATHKSGTRITARLATEYNREVLAVPGSMFSQQSEGPNELIRMGATPVTTSEHILEALGFQVTEQPMLDLFSQCNPDEQRIIELLTHPQSRGDLIRKLNLPIHKATVLITQMEVKGFICESEGVVRRR
ncbi:MAG: DNA-processing protein DprA [bacterium]